MIFKGIDNQTFELRILNYQFPHETKDNWLNIYINVKSNLGSWGATDPALTTWEIKALIDWLTKLSENKKTKWPYLVFTELSLSFELLNSYKEARKKIRVNFNFELRPYSDDDEIDYYFDIDCSNDELKKYCSDLNKELEKYPER